MSTFQTDLSYWPIVLQGLQGRDDACLNLNVAEAWQEIFRRKEPYVALVDMTGAFDDPKESRANGQWLQQHRDDIRRHCLGVALVAPSPKLKDALADLFWVEPLAVPYFLCDNVAEGYQWVREKLQEAGILEPPGAAPFFRQFLYEESLRRQA